MIGQLLTILAGILALIGASAISFTYLEQTVGPRPVVEEAPVLTVAKKELPPPATTTPAIAKKVAPKPVVAPRPTQKKVVAPVAVAPTAPKIETVVTPVAPVAQKAVVAPGPLVATVSTPTTSDLSVRGVIEYTNGARSLNGGLPALIENSLLNLDAEMKLADMFAKQYFEHVSPTGVGPADLAKVAGYSYVIVGENLALGDFGSDAKLVDAWMNSPGHRANILKPQYQEIGVAVGKGMYKGSETWLAVQSFGMPLSACPAIDAGLRAQIDANNITIANLRAQLDAKKAQIDSTAQSDPNYNTYVEEFNAIVPEYNNLAEMNRVNVAKYNSGVQAYNDCINAAGAH